MSQLMAAKPHLGSYSLVSVSNDLGALFCHPVVTFIQFQGALVLALLGLGWLLAGVARRGELLRQERKHADPEKTKQELPGVSVVLPLKGCKRHGLRNWESQLMQDYDGPLELIAVVDSKADPALEVVSQLAGSKGGRRIRTVIAGPALTSSQKIHNLQAGIKAACKNHKYVLCVDDDVCLHPTTLRDSICAMEQQPEAFMATGYPFDIPPPGSNVLTHCVLGYHLPLLIAFSISRRTHFVWGGFMLFRLQAMLADSGGILQAWARGGYSDDLIVAAKCSEGRLPIICPAFTVFPQWLDGEYDSARYWNYLRRQLYVMDTYASPLNRRINHAFMVVHSYLSLAFVLPLTTATLRLLLGCLQLALHPPHTLYRGPGTSLHWPGHLGSCQWALASLAAFLASFAACFVSLRWMTGVMLSLFGSLSPNSEPVSRSSFNWSKLWLGLYVNNCVIPICMLYTWLDATVVWSGVEYTRRGGRIVKIRRMDDTADG